MNGVQTSRFLGRREPEVQGRAPTCHSSRQVIAKIIRSGGFFIVIKAIKNINNMDLQQL